MQEREEVEQTLHCNLPWRSPLRYKHMKTDEVGLLVADPTQCNSTTNEDILQSFRIQNALKLCNLVYSITVYTFFILIFCTVCRVAPGRLRPSLVNFMKQEIMNCIHYQQGLQKLLPSVSVKCDSLVGGNVLIVSFYLYASSL